MKLLNLPNIITSLNLLSGCMAIFFAMHYEANPEYTNYACMFIILGAVFDFFDGLTARALGISGPIGKELDSLADVCTFGIAPSALCYYLMEQSGFGICSLLAFLIAAFSALRLAKFNCDERQTTSFIGLPTPANALLWIGLVQMQGVMQMQWLMNSWALLLLMIICSYLLICELPMFSLKMKKGHMSLRENYLQYTFVLLSLFLILLFTLLGNIMASASVIIVLYIFTSVLYKINKTATSL